MDCDKHFGLVDLGQIRLKGNTTGGIEGQFYSFVIAISMGLSIGTVVPNECCVYVEGRGVTVTLPLSTSSKPTAGTDV
jgi:hypothetical protein